MGRAYARRLLTISRAPHRYIAPRCVHRTRDSSPRPTPRSSLPRPPPPLPASPLLTLSHRAPTPHHPRPQSRSLPQPPSLQPLPFSRLRVHCPVAPLQLHTSPLHGEWPPTPPAHGRCHRPSLLHRQGVIANAFTLSHLCSLRHRALPLAIVMCSQCSRRCQPCRCRARLHTRWRRVVRSCPPTFRWQPQRDECVGELDGARSTHCASTVSP